jgi:hypothetical protein
MVATTAEGDSTYGRVRVLFRAILAGTIASSAMLFAFVGAYGGAGLAAALIPTSWPIIGVIGRWFNALTQNVLIDTARPNLYVALAVFFAGGVGWAILYAFFFRWRPDAAPWQRGLMFAVIPWGFSLVVFLPLVGGGFLGLSLGAGPLPIVGNFVLHAVYGMTLGMVHASELAEDIVATGASDVGASDATLSASANRFAEVGAASGFVIGAVLGTVVALVTFVIWLPGGVAAPATPVTFTALNPMATALAIVLIGGTLGMFVGSLAGLSAALPSRR